MHLRNSMDPIDVALVHAPRPVGVVRLPRLEGLDLVFLTFVVPRDVGDEVLDQRERLDRLDENRLRSSVEVAQAGHAHQPRHAVDLGRAGAALAGLAVPAHREVVGAWL